MERIVRKAVEYYTRLMVMSCITLTCCSRPDSLSSIHASTIIFCQEKTLQNYIFYFFYHINICDDGLILQYVLYRYNKKAPYIIITVYRVNIVKWVPISLIGYKVMITSSGSTLRAVGI